MADARHTLEDVITILVRLLPRSLTRTSLVKLLYFVDLRSWEQRGHPLTGLHWAWHYYGPYSREITETVADLEAADELSVEVSFNSHGSVIYRILPGPRPALYGVLSDADHALIRDVVRQFGKYTATQITRLSYQTAPIENAVARGTDLDFSMYVERGNRPVEFVPDLRRPPSPKMASSWGLPDTGPTD